MGHKGVSKRNSKKTRPFSNSDIVGSPKIRSADQPFAQSALKDNRASLSRGGMNPSAGMGKNQKKGR